MSFGGRSAAVCHVGRMWIGLRVSEIVGRIVMCVVVPGARGSWMCGAVHVPCVWWLLVAVCRVAGGARRDASLCVDAWR